MSLQIEEGTFAGFDGAELFFQTWTKPKPKAIIIGFHGLGEHSGAYGHLAEGLEETGYQLIMSDHRGHGRSAGKRGVGSVDEFIRDQKLFFEVVKNRFPNKPLFFLGHSMGGLVLLKFLIRHGDMGALGFVLSSPLLGVTAEIPPFKRKSAGFLTFFAPNLTLSNEIPNTHLSHDTKITSSYEADHWRHDRISAGLFTAMLKDMDYVFSCGDKLRLPLLMQQSGQDLVVSQSKAGELFKTLKMKDKKLIVYKDFYHEIYNEVGRAQVFKDLIEWLDRHLEEGSKI